MLDFYTVKKIDGHIHIIPDEVHKANPDADNTFSKAKLERYLKLMDEYKIQKAAIMPFNDPFLMSMAFDVSSVHQNLYDIKKTYPERFYIFADIDPRNEAQTSLAHIKEAIELYHFDGIKIHPNNSGIALDDPYFDEIYAYALKSGVAIIMHSYPNFEDDLGAPKRIARVLDRFKGLRLMVSHMGAYQYEDLLGLDIYVDLAAILPDYVKKLGLRETKKILRSFRIKRLVFASDWPDSRLLESEAIYPSYFAILNEMNFKDEEIKRIAHDNFEDFILGR